MTDNKIASTLDENRTIFLIVGAGLILLVTVLMLWFVTKPSFEVLMQSPTEADLAKAVQELENQGVNYQITEDGLNILVKESDSAKARTALSELGLPYEATIGLELFATSDFGVTEFAQKVNYKRALEGELTRTISSLSEVRYARVHLVLPEKRMFEKTSGDASSAVTLFLRDGISLTETQVKGIQNLVASSVPMVSADRVTVLDQNGVTLNGKRSTLIGGGYNDLLKDKKSHESYIKQKIERLLMARYSNSVFAVEVDVTLSSVSSKVVEKTLLPLTSNKGALISTRFTKNNSPSEKGESLSKSNEEKYEYGSRVEESINAAGQGEGVTVAIFISQDLELAEIEQLENLVVAVAGLKSDRGDNVSIMAVAPPQPSKTVVDKELVQPVSPFGWAALNEQTIVLIVALLCSILIIFVCLIALVKSNKKKAPSLTSAQRDALLSKLNEWAGESGNEKV